MNGIVEAIVILLGFAGLLILAATPVIMFFKLIDYLELIDFLDKKKREDEE